MVTRASPGQGSNVSPGSPWPRKYRAELCETRPPADYKLAVRPRPCPVSRKSGLRINQVSFRSQPTDQLDHPTKYSAYEGPTKQRSAVVLRLRLEAGVRWPRPERLSRPGASLRTAPACKDRTDRNLQPTSSDSFHPTLSDKTSHFLAGWLSYKCPPETSRLTWRITQQSMTQKKNRLNDQTGRRGCRVSCSQQLFLTSIILMITKIKTTLPFVFIGKSLQK